MIRKCPLCGPVEARVVSVDIRRPDGQFADEYRCAPRGHLFVVNQTCPDPVRGSGDPGR